MSPSASISPSPVVYELSTDYFDVLVSIVYQDTYTKQGSTFTPLFSDTSSTFSEAYQAQNTQFTDQFTPQDTEFSDEYTGQDTQFVREYPPVTRPIHE